MGDDEREERRQSQTLCELIDRLGHLPLSELTTEQKRELHAATSGFVWSNAPDSFSDLPALLALAESSLAEATVLLEHSLPGSDERAGLLELTALLSTAIPKIRAALGSRSE